MSDKRMYGHLQRDVTVHQDVIGAFGDEFSCGDSEHVHTAAETVYVKEDV